MQHKAVAIHGDEAYQNWSEIWEPYSPLPILAWRMRFGGSGGPIPPRFVQTHPLHTDRVARSGLRRMLGWDLDRDRRRQPNRNHGGILFGVVTFMLTHARSPPPKSQYEAAGWPNAVPRVGRRSRPPRGQAVPVLDGHGR